MKDIEIYLCMYVDITWLLNISLLQQLNMLNRNITLDTLTFSGHIMVYDKRYSYSLASLAI